MALLEKIAGLGAHRQRFWRATGCQVLVVDAHKVRIYSKTFRFDLELTDEQISLTDCKLATLLISATLKKRGVL